MTKRDDIEPLRQTSGSPQLARTQKSETSKYQSIYLPEDPSDLQQRVLQLEKINQALIRRVERSMDQRANSYSLFQSAILLEEQVRARTIELREALEELEISNLDLSLAKEQAESSNHSKTRFLAAASHDLMQPLSAARLNMTALKSEDVSGQTAELINRVDRSLTTLEDLLRTLFDISKLDAGVSVPEIISYPSEVILRTIFSDFAPLAKQKDLKLTLFSLAMMVETDPIYLRRILQNLVSNALRYTSRGGVLIGCRRRGNRLIFEVWDTGAGIPSSEHKRIFDEFHRCRNTSHQDGLGLGLAIVARMASAVDHQIEFHSRLDQGSVFRVSVPLSVRQLDTSETYARPSQVTTQSLKLEDAFIVLVEDDPDVRVAMKTLLTKWGAQCLTANGLEQIEARLKDIERVPDLIIADYHLVDDFVGPEVVRAVRKRFESEAPSQIPSLIVSATPTDEAIKMAAKEHCEFLAKPVEPAELRALLVRLLNG